VHTAGKQELGNCRDGRLSLKSRRELETVKTKIYVAKVVNFTLAEGFLVTYLPLVSVFV